MRSRALRFGGLPRARPSTESFLNSRRGSRPISTIFERQAVRPPEFVLVAEIVHADAEQAHGPASGLGLAEELNRPCDDLGFLPRRHGGVAARDRGEVR